MDKSYGIYMYYWQWEGHTQPYYIGKDSYINNNLRDRQHRTKKNPTTIIDKVLQGKHGYKLKYKVIAKFPDEETMTMHEAILIDYYMKQDLCKANIVNELQNLTPIVQANSGEELKNKKPVVKTDFIIHKR